VVKGLAQGQKNTPGEVTMKETAVRLGPREQQIADLLLQGCDNDEIAKQLHMARRTVKAHFNRLFLRFGISGGIKRVKLATLLYRRQLCSNDTENEPQVNESSELSSLSPKDSKTKRLLMQLEHQNTLSKTISEPSTTNLDSGTASNLPSGMKLEDTRSQQPDVTESWEHRILDLNVDAAPGAS
jgi:hypothetical protein